jgi:hypothetical protein
MPAMTYEAMYIHEAAVSRSCQMRMSDQAIATLSRKCLEKNLFFSASAGG